MAANLADTPSDASPHRPDGATPSEVGRAPYGLVPDLAPARWVWYPSQRCLANSMVLFRRELTLPAAAVRAVGWILADSRYLLTVNGRRVQWGPTPCDPRWVEADPLDLAAYLRAGRNVIGVQVLHYGHGDGTWPTGKPGLVFRLDWRDAAGGSGVLASDGGWQTHWSRAWRAGQYKRWYLRAFQEEFDSRLHPQGWDEPGFVPGDDWQPAMEIDGSPNKPAVCSSYPDYLNEQSADPALCGVFTRQVPGLIETDVPVRQLTESHWVRWSRPAEECFALGTTDACAARWEASAVADEQEDGWWIDFDAADPGEAAVLTFELAEQVVGWPRFEIEAPTGTVVEVLVQEAHAPKTRPLVGLPWHSWSRLICREGWQRFEPFDFESFRWLQLHIREATGPVRVRGVGARRRIYPWPQEPAIRVGEPELQRLVTATINTLHNCAQENCVDGMARERQQYSGDCGHQLHAIYNGFGEFRLPARYLRTYSHGLTVDGYFLDCWPAYDRLCRVMGRQIQLASWGPILDHGVGFVFDCLNHLLYSGDADALTEPYPRLVRFARYLRSLVQEDGLLPVENIGVPCVWIDHQGFQQQRHKQAAFNLYAAGMLRRALPALCRRFGQPAEADWAEAFGAALEKAVVRKFWSRELGLFVDNLPWLNEEGEPRTHDRTLATAVLFDQCPGGPTEAVLTDLVDCPTRMGFSYPANAGWRLWALGKLGRADVIVGELRGRWAVMQSVKLNNTLSEDWEVAPDSGSQWSHCPVVPVYVMFMEIAGIRPTAPGFAKYEVRPQPVDLKSFDITAHTVQGPLRVQVDGEGPSRLLTVSTPAGGEGELILPANVKTPLPTLGTDTRSGERRYRLPAGRTIEVPLVAR